MNKKEIVNVLSGKSFNEKCAYCNEEITRGYYAEDNIGKKLIFPKCITKNFAEKEIEIPIHYKCVEPFLLDILREGEEYDGTSGNTKILIRY